MDLANNYDDADEVLGIFKTNGMIISPTESGLFPWVCRANHSCVPNCTVVFNGRELVIKATQDIDAGEIPNVAFISYVNTMDDTKTRQKQQQANWFFTCRCSLCRDTR